MRILSKEADRVLLSANRAAPASNLGRGIKCKFKPLRCSCPRNKAMQVVSQGDERPRSLISLALAILCRMKASLLCSLVLVHMCYKVHLGLIFAGRYGLPPSVLEWSLIQRRDTTTLI